MHLMVLGTGRGVGVTFGLGIMCVEVCKGSVSQPGAVPWAVSHCTGGHGGEEQKGRGLCAPLSAGTFCFTPILCPLLLRWGCGEAKPMKRPCSEDCRVCDDLHPKYNFQSFASLCRMFPLLLQHVSPLFHGARQWPQWFMSPSSKTNESKTEPLRCGLL